MGNTNLAEAYKNIGDQAKQEEVLKKLQQLEGGPDEQSRESNATKNQ